MDDPTLQLQHEGYCEITSENGRIILQILPI